MRDEYNHQSASQPQRKLSWSEGFQLYMHDPHAHSLLRFALRWAPLLLPATVVSDVLIPLIGPLAVVDNALYWPLLIVAVFKMLYKVDQYRKNPPASSGNNVARQ
jgi:hypothetical protein